MEELTLVDAFERTAQKLLQNSPPLSGLAMLARKGRSVALSIPSLSTTGFDVGATCETYGLYPTAGEWQGAPWEPVLCTGNELVEVYFGFVRMLLSLDARLRHVYWRDRLEGIIVELQGVNGWTTFDDQAGVMGLVEKRELVRQNDSLPPRFPYAGLEQTSSGIYLWKEDD